MSPSASNRTASSSSTCLILDVGAWEVADRWRSCANLEVKLIRRRGASIARSHSKQGWLEAALEGVVSDRVLLAPEGCSFDVEDVQRVDATLAHGAVAAVACRRAPESRFSVPSGDEGKFLIAAMNDAWLSWCARTVLNVPFRDLFSGLVGLRRETARRLAPCVRRTGWLWQAELLTACHRMGLPVNEVPVTCAYPWPRPTPSLEKTVDFMRSLRAIRRTRPSLAGPPKSISIDDSQVEAA